MSRIGLIREKLGDADAALITHLPDIRWAVGFTGSSGVLLVDRTDAHFFTDGRYTEQAVQEVRDAKVVIVENGLFDSLVGADNDFHLKELNQIILQADHLTLSQFKKLRNMKEGGGWVEETDLLAREVAAKDEEEISAVGRAQQVTCAVFEDVLDSIEPGVTERELAAEITYQHLCRGCSAMAFAPIVASGPRSAFPHARPSSAELKVGEPVLLDFGGVLDGYCSDFTRTLFLGSPSEKQRSAYQAVLSAQEAALEVLSAGVSGSAVDAAARNTLAKDGLDVLFTHSTGHGVGLEVHEWPRLSKTSEDLLPEGAVVTVEPGVYVAEEFGIRIEDVVAVEAEGCRNLTPATKELLVL